MLIRYLIFLNWFKLFQNSIPMETYRRHENARITATNSLNDVVHALQNSMEMKTYRRHEKAIITVTDSPNDVVRSLQNSTEMKTYWRREKARIIVTDSSNDIVWASLPVPKSTELKTYHRHGRGMSVTIFFNDVVLAPLRFHIFASPSGKIRNPKS